MVIPNKAYMAKLLRGANASAPIVPAFASTNPGTSGGAYVGSTVTAVHGVWSKHPIQYESGWFYTNTPPFTNLTRIAGQSALTYTYVSGDVGNKICYGERILTADGRWSQWAYSPLSAFISATPVLNPPTITTAAAGTPTTGLQVASVLTISAPVISNASSWSIHIERDGLVDPETLADYNDTFPFTYTLQNKDICTNFRILTFANNGAGDSDNVATAPNIGPVQQNQSLIFQDLGSAQATENHILTYFVGSWAKTGTATQQRTVSSPDALVTLWQSEVLTSPMSERWEITLDWNGLAMWGTAETYIDGAGNNREMPLFGPPGAASWKDVGGWVHLKAASGKRPGFLNQVGFANGRGILLEGLDFCGKRNKLAGLKSGQSGPTAQGCILTTTYTSNAYTGEAIIHLYNCRVGRYAKTLVFDETETVMGIGSASTQEELVIDTCSFAGCYAALKGGWRRCTLTNVDVSKNYEDINKTYPNNKSGFISSYIYDRVTVRDMIDLPSIAAAHSDLWQVGSGNANLGWNMLMKKTWAIMDHKYGGTGAGGGTQGLEVGTNNAGHSQNVICVRDSGILISAIHCVVAESQNGIYTSYVENCHLGRCGITPSQFGGEAANKDWSPGVYKGAAPTRSGIAFKFNNVFLGTKPSAAFIQYNNTVSVDWSVSMTGLIPENAFLGPAFERGGLQTANGLTNKFGYLVDNSSQAAYIQWIIDNFTPKAAYTGKGAPLPNPADYSAPALG